MKNSDHFLSERGLLIIDCSILVVENRQVIFIVVGVAAVIIAVFFAFGFTGTVKVDDEVKATLSELASNFIVRQMF